MRRHSRRLLFISSLTTASFIFGVSALQTQTSSQKMGVSSSAPSLVDSLLASEGIPTPKGDGLSLALRKAEIFAVATRVVADYKLLSWRCNQIEDEALKDLLWDQAHERNAKLLYAKFTKLEALWLKLGQYLSSRADVMPEPFLRELKNCQDALPSPPWEVTKRTIEEDLKQPLSSVFRSIEETPLAVASIASVHRAVLHDGSNVVVKVRHLNVKEQLIQDLKCLETIGETVKWLDPDFDFSPVVREWSKEVPKELDFTREAAYMSRVSSNLAIFRNNDPHSSSVLHPLSIDATLATVIPGLTTERVMVMKFIDGVKISNVKQLDALGVDRDAIVRDIIKAYACQIFVDGCFSGDPHPGNLLVDTQTKKPVLLDFGLTKEISDDIKFNFCKFVVATDEMDIHGLLTALDGIGLKFRTDVPFDVSFLSKYFFREAKKAAEAQQENTKRRAEWKAKTEEKARVLYVGDKVDVMEKNWIGWKSSRKGEIIDSSESQLLVRFNDDSKGWHSRENVKLQKSRSPIDGWPDSFIFFERVLGLLRGLTASLDVNQNYISVMGPYARLSLAKHPQSCKTSSPTAVTGIDNLNVGSILTDALSCKDMLGAQVCVMRNGETLVDLAAGLSDPYSLQPVDKDTLFCR